ncbi:MAG: glycosyltransferase family 39 protein [bacterium]|nr:glycosyltransferase family 39 protein [bacterium]
MIHIKFEIKKFLFEHWLICLITVIAAGMRFYALSEKSFWVDEIIATLVSSRPIDRIFAIRVDDVTPPLRDYLAHFLFLVFGRGEFALRLPSAVFGTASIPLLYFIGYKWFNKSTGIIAAILLTISPFFLHHSQDGRMYPMFIFFSISSLFLLLLAIEKEKKTWLYWLGFIVVTALNIYTTYFAFWALIAELVIAVIFIIVQKISNKQQKPFLWKKIGALMFCLIVIMVLYLPWLPVLIDFIAKNIHAPLPYKYTFKVSPTEKEIANTLYPFRVWFGQSFFEDLLEKYGVVSYGAYLYLLFYLIGIFAAFDRNPKYAMVLILWFIIPLIILFSPPAKVLFFPRYISFIMPLYLLGIAYGIGITSERITRKLFRGKSKSYLPVTGFIMLLFALVVVKPIADYYRTEKQNWRGAVEYLASHAENNDIIVVGPYNAKWCVLYYVPPEAESKQIQLVEKCNTVKELQRLCAKHSRVWFITAYYRYYEYRTPQYFDWIEQHFGPPVIFTGKTDSDNIYVFLYQHEEPTQSLLTPRLAKK